MVLQGGRVVNTVAYGEHIDGNGIDSLTLERHKELCHFAEVRSGFFSG
jgi:hypothetical protein